MADNVLEELNKIMRDDADNYYLDLSVDYAEAGLYIEAIRCYYKDI